MLIATSTSFKEAYAFAGFVGVKERLNPFFKEASLSRKLRFQGSFALVRRHKNNNPCKKESVGIDS
ncbi:hypothetical protein BKH43_03325 [Helicobacter sp. 13S00401-1]|nr:hypothetical protein BKH43_03325 [Helicobacter sp. 13S00401-1]